MKDFLEEYRTIENKLYYEFEVEKSIFITNCCHVKNEEMAKDFIDEIKEKYKDANHNCSAYIINSKPIIKRYSDDGEPQASAGLPMLSVLEKENLKNIVVVVSRYFGGKKLGKAGLIRTYGKAVSDCLKEKMIFSRPFYKISLTLDYNNIGLIENYINEKNIKIIEKSYTDKVEIYIYVYNKKLGSVKNDLINLTSNNIKIDIIDEVMLFEN